MTVSVVLPAHNAEQTLRRSLNSLLGQSYQDWEAIVVENGSRDATSKIANAYAEIDSRVKVFSTQRTGVSNARNVGIAKATGKYIGFLDADDTYSSDSLLLRTAAMERGADVVHCPVEMVSVAGEELNWRVFKTSPITCHDFYQNPTHLNAVMARAEIIKNLKFRTDLSNGEDWLYLGELFRLGFVSIPVMLGHVNYTLGAQGAVGRDLVRHEVKCLVVLNSFYSDSHFGPARYRAGLLTPPMSEVVGRRGFSMVCRLAVMSDREGLLRTWRNDDWFVWGSLNATERLAMAEAAITWTLGVPRPTAHIHAKRLLGSLHDTLCDGDELITELEPVLEAFTRLAERCDGANPA